MRWFLVVVFLAGCQLPGMTSEQFQTISEATSALEQLPEAQSPGMIEIAKTVTEMIKDQGVIDEFLANARGHGLNPGLKASFGTESWVKIGLDGVDVDVYATTEGGGTKLPTGVRQELIKILALLEDKTDGPSIELRESIIQILGWNRQPDVP